jgi:hypothetical protein
MSKLKVTRHGEILFVPIKKLPDGLKESKTNEIMRGSSNNPHSFDQGKIYLWEVDQYIFGYFVAKNTTLLHAEHGDDHKAELPNGIYELRRACEKLPDGLRPVID